MSGGEGNDGSSGQDPGGRRRDGHPYRDGNLREDGSYIVGRGRPPKSGRYAKGDGRRRGRRTKGVRNADTEFERELNRRMVIKENGVERKVTKSHAVDLRLIDNATRKGDNRAIEMVDARRRRIAEARENNRRQHTLSDQAILEAYLRERREELQIDPSALHGDPDPGIEGAADSGETSGHGHDRSDPEGEKGDG